MDSYIIPQPTGDPGRDIAALYEALCRLWELEEYHWALTQKGVKHDGR